MSAEQQARSTDATLAGLAENTASEFSGVSA
jgi:hypothetical protein